MKPYQHAQISAFRYGGAWQDWIGFHSWIDQTKALFAGMQHRMILHSNFGAHLAIRVLGEAIATADGMVSARTSDLFADHQLEDLGRIVPLSEWLRETSTDINSKRRRPPRRLEPVRDSATEGLASLWGGEPSDYAPLVEFFDLPARLAEDYAERAMLITHSSFGIFLSEQLLGITTTLTQPAGAGSDRARVISTRSAAEDLVYARLGLIPSASQLPSLTRLRLWMRGTGVRPALRTRIANERGGRQMLELLDSCNSSDARKAASRA
jgi:hypothetical protein